MRNTVSPTAAPTSAALNAEEMTEPARPLRLLAGGNSSRVKVMNVNIHKRAIANKERRVKRAAVKS